MTTSIAAAPAAGPALDAQRWRALGVIALATLMVVLDASIINIALPHAQAELGISDAHRHWAVTAYTISFGGLLLLGGRVADYVGRKRAMIAGLLGFAGASVAGGLAGSAELLFAARAVQGAVAAVLAPAALSLVTVTFVEPHERGKAFGVYGAVQGAGGALGLILGGFLTEYVSWRWCMFVNAPIALVAALAAVGSVRESRAEGPRRYDLAGALLATLAAVGLVYGFTLAAENGWAARGTLATLAGAVLLLAAFVAVEARSRHPLLPLGVVADRDRGGSFLTATLIGAGMFGMLLFLTFYLQVNLGYTPVRAGLAFLPFTLGIIVVAMSIAGPLARRGPKPLMVTGLALATAGMAWLATVGASSTFLTLVLPAELLMGVGLGLVFVPMNSTALHGVRPEHAGVASGLLDATQQLGGALGVALLNALYTISVAGHLARTDDAGGARFAGYHVAFATGTGLFVAALLATGLMIAPTRTRPSA